MAIHHPDLSEGLAGLDRGFMARALQLARHGAGRAWPNPIVGAVVAREGREIASGYHARFGEAHAEVAALDAAGVRARGATLYVGLEPCAHHGHTPPCVERILQAGIARVVVPARDPDPRVNGAGLHELRAAGIGVEVGCEAESGILENLGYYRRRLGYRSTVTLKIAASADGMAARAPGRRDEVTGAAARRDVHSLRALHDAVVVGVETAVVDRPLLDCRLLEGGVDGDPLPVVIDTHLRIAADASWPRAGRAFVAVVGPKADAARVRAIESRGGRVVRCAFEHGRVSVTEAVERLAEMGLERILVEGGPRLLDSFLRAGVWDALWWYRSAAVFGAGLPWFAERVPDPGRRVDETSVGQDVRHRFVNPARWDPMFARIATAAE